MEITSRQIRFLARMGSRGAFGDTIYRLAQEKKEFFALSADLGHASGFDRLMKEFPEKYVNVGIAEQDLVGVAAGLAKDGTPVVATTYSPFASFRCADQVRNYLGYMNLNVKVVGLDAGMIQSTFGGSHYGTEDLTLMRAIPNLTVISPSDGVQIALAVEAMMEYKGPVYLRVSGGPFLPPIYNDSNATFKIGKANVLKEGEKIAFIGTGSVVYNVVQAANELEQEGINCTVIDMHTIKPLDTECLDSLADYDYIFTVEEHTTKGGLGGAVAEYYADRDKKPRQIMIGVDDMFPHPGSHEHLIKTCHLDKESLVNTVKGVFAGNIR